MTYDAARVLSIDVSLECFNSMDNMAPVAHGRDLEELSLEQALRTGRGALMAMDVEARMTLHGINKDTVLKDVHTQQDDLEKHIGEYVASREQGDDTVFQLIFAIRRRRTLVNRALGRMRPLDRYLYTSAEDGAFSV